MLSSPRSRRLALFAVSATAVLAGATAAGTAFASAPASRQTPPVSVSLDGSFVFHACGADVPAADACLTDHVSGTLPGIGAVTSTFEVHIAYSQAAADSCAPIDKHGAFTAADGSTLTLVANGMFCGSNSIASYNYRVVRGTGSLAKADGRGQWLVPPATTFDYPAGTGPELFFGSLLD